MAIEVRALDQDEFNAATQGSYVYGTVSGYVKGKMLTAYVLVENLGKEQSCVGRKYENVPCKFFVSGEIYYAQTEQDIDNQEFDNAEPFREAIILLG